jgi:hypothetical protein
LQWNSKAKMIRPAKIFQLDVSKNFFG